MVKETNEQKRQFIIQRFYIQDLSFEAPNSPKIFTADWKPDMNLDVHIDSSHLEEDNYEVIVHLLIKVQSEEQVAFLVDVKQAGIFSIIGFEKDELQHTLECFCATTLYPYAREVVTDLVMKGGFPQLLLPPVNFESIFENKQQAKKESEKESTVAH